MDIDGRSFDCQKKNPETGGTFVWDWAKTQWEHEKAQLRISLKKAGALPATHGPASLKVPHGVSIA